MRGPALLPEVVRRFLGDAARGPGVVAVSGGPDSVALLRALAEASAGAPLVVAHLNHQLRGAESDTDEAFVRDLHARLAAEAKGEFLLRCERVDAAREVAAQGGNLESVARDLRYEWLARVAAEAGAAWVATGHTADDQAETVLFRLLRGTGLKGLAGIPARRPLAAGVEVVRPLLTVRRADVLAYLEVLNQPYRVDSTNARTELTRNRIRHGLLPLLAADYNPAVVEVLGRLADQAAAVEGVIEQAAAALLREAELPRAGTLLVFDLARLGKSDRHLLREMLRLAWQREGWPLSDMGYEEWDRAAAVALGEVEASDLPGGVRARRRGRVLQLGVIPTD